MRSVKIAALAAAGVLALAGCAGSSPRVAAYVNGAEIRTEQIDAVAAVMARESGKPAGAFSAGITNAYIQGRLAQSALAKAGVTVTDAQRAQVITQTGATALASDPTTADFARAYADYALLSSSQEGSAALTQESTQTEVRLNPRYGTWDSSQGSITGSGSISFTKS